jgi:hypothetical protein
MLIGKGTQFDHNKSNCITQIGYASKPALMIYGRMDTVLIHKFKSNHEIDYNVLPTALLDE